MDKFVTLFDPSFIGYDPASIYALCQKYTENDDWDEIYPGIPLDSKRYSEEFLETDGRKIIEAFHPDLNITYQNAQIFRMTGNDRGPIHRDTDRLCGVLFPITPIGEDFAPIRFHHEDKMEFCRLNYSRNAIILNVLELHSIPNNGHERINFQIDIHLPYADVVDLYRSGRLFR